MKFTGEIGEHFELLESESENKSVVEKMDGKLSMIWFVEDGSSLEIDANTYHFKKDQIIFLTNFNKISNVNLKAHRYLSFNAQFYCILNHDSEVGCKGILFFGSSGFPIINPDIESLNTLEAVWKMLKEEMRSKDNLQLEMLQMMLKRILILSTRILKTQENYDAIESNQADIIREFNFLLELHFKEKHSVKDYAALMNKSPKTLSNLFGKLGEKSPLQFIQSRITLESNRLLRYTDLPVSEVAYDLGFNDVQSFSRFFKKNSGISPSDYRLA